jgi:hypothetical protein
MEATPNFEEIRPWRFRDDNMEFEYQAACVATVIERMKPASIYFLIPMQSIATLSLILLRLLNPYPWTMAEFLFSMYRVLVGTSMTIVFLVEWSEKIKVKLGHVLIGVTRLSYITTGIQQAGLQQHDSEFLFLLIWIQYFSGIVTASFTEYSIAAIILSCIKPIRLYLWPEKCLHQSQQCTMNEYWQVFQHHAILLFMGLSITGLMHTDRRRLWVSSRGRLTSRSKSSRKMKVSGTVGRNHSSSFGAAAQTLKISRVVGSGSFGTFIRRSVIFHEKLLQ